MLIARGLSALTVVMLLGASSGQSSPQPLPRLVAQRVYWNATLSDFAMISVCIDTAAMAAVDGDLIRAARALAYGEKYIGRVTAAVHEIPPNWRSRVGPHLSQATLAFAAAASTLRLYLAHGRVTDLKTAQTDQARAAAELVAGTGEAKTAYASMGGDPGDLQSVPHAMQDANAAFASAMGDTDTDDQ
jgi:hypothetical protein